MLKSILLSIIIVCGIVATTADARSFSSGGYSSGRSSSFSSSSRSFSSSSYSSRPSATRSFSSSSYAYKPTQSVVVPRSTPTYVGGGYGYQAPVQHHYYGGGGGGTFSSPWFWMWAMDHNNNRQPVYVNGGGATGAYGQPAVIQQQAPDMIGYTISIIFQILLLILFVVGIVWIARKLMKK